MERVSIECRIYAEDPDHHFIPSPGKITYLDMPSGPGIRLDSGVYSGWTVPIDYDPLLAKLAVWASTRDAAIHRMRRALHEMPSRASGPMLAFFEEILDDEDFQAGNLSTAFLDGFFKRRRPRPAPDLEMEAIAVMIAALQRPKGPTAGACSPQRMAHIRTAGAFAVKLDCIVDGHSAQLTILDGTRFAISVTVRVRSSASSRSRLLIRVRIRC